MRSSKLLVSAASLCLALMVVVQSIYSQPPFVTFTLDAKSCIPGGGVTSYSNCPALYSTINYCNEPGVATGPDALACYCNQDYLNLLFKCHDEERLCIGNTDLDGNFQSDLDVWNNACDTETTSAITTPLLSSIVVSENIDYCSTAFSACNSFSTLEYDCDNSYSGQNFFSCACQPKVLSLLYTCAFLGNVSCLHSPAALTNLPDYGYCSNLVAVLGPLENETGPASSPATVTSNGNPSYTPSNTVILTTPLGPGSLKVSTGPTATKSSMGVDLFTMSLERSASYSVILVLCLILGA